MEIIVDLDPAGLYHYDGVVWTAVPGHSDDYLEEELNDEFGPEAHKSTRPGNPVRNQALAVIKEYGGEIVVQSDADDDWDKLEDQEVV